MGSAGEAEDTWEFVYLRNVDIGRVPAAVLDGIWRSMGVDRTRVAHAGAIGAYLAEFVVRSDYRAQFVQLLSSIRAPQPLDDSLMVSEDRAYQPAAPHLRAIPAGCTVPQRAMAALDEYARSSLARRWAEIYHSATQPGVRQLICASLAEHSLPAPPPAPASTRGGRSEGRQALGAPRQGSDIVHARSPNHAILSVQHLAELIPRPCATRVVIYTDGAYLLDRCAAGMGAYFEGTDIPPVAERLPGHQSNARAEICAMTLGLERLAAELLRGRPALGGICEVWACTDSRYVVDGVNIYRETWQSANWLNAKGRRVANRTAFQRLYASIQRLSDRGFNVFVHHLPAHAGIAGNEFADMLAKAGALLS
ncbi:Ribonuclease H1 [Coemansia nantahalensis]|uniref:Ribonuclease H1 n=1 Tax=Coemansia nantahalensis TaxID=2789366 RepID=A0ACC1K558_9FUNG|nr:Ribonuclease H1 [Coemansia nantahalensis]